MDGGSIPPTSTKRGADWKQKGSRQQYVQGVCVLQKNKRMDVSLMRVKNFVYNGFSGKMTSGYASYTAEFKRWTEDPGIAVCACSDGKERLIPSFALDGFQKPCHS